MENRSGKRWEPWEDALLRTHKDRDTVARLIGRSRYAVADRRRFMGGNRQARKFSAPHSCDPRNMLHRMSSELEIGIMPLRAVLRKLVEAGKLPPPRVNNKAEYDWKRGWKDPSIYDKAKRMVLNGT